MESYLNNEGKNININDFLESANKETGILKNKKNNSNFPLNKNISEFNIKEDNNIEKVITIGDRFIPNKNSDNNIQNFKLFSSPFNINSSGKIDYSSSIESKPEKNYVNFIIDNMLENSSEEYIIRNNKKRKNKIFSFSKNIYNTANNCRSKILFNNNIEYLDIINNNLNEKRKTNNFNYELNDELDNDINNHLFNNLNTSIGYDKKGIMTFKNKFFNYDNNCYKNIRKISNKPIRILDAPNLVDDFYLNLLDWGKENIIAVALSDEIYLWNDNNFQSNLLMTNEKKYNDNSLEDNDNITSLSFMNNGICLAVGLPNGAIQLWDIYKKIKLREINAHEDRVTCLSWNDYILSSGSKDRFIINFDVRNKHAEICKIKKHKQEICSLKYSIEKDLLASGGNDNTAYIWDIRNLQNPFSFLSEESNHNFKPYSINNFHQAAVKAMAWCPWKRHILATGGGCKDKTIKIFSCDYNKILKNINSGSQVCSLLWNQKEKEIISSHGYNKNQIIIWNYEKSKKICELKGHMNRVLFLTMSPDESIICSGSGDETLRFWKINNEPINSQKNENKNSLLNNIILH